MAKVFFDRDTEFDPCQGKVWKYKELAALTAKVGRVIGSSLA